MTEGLYGGHKIELLNERGFNYLGLVRRASPFNQGGASSRKGNSGCQLAEQTTAPQVRVQLNPEVFSELTLQMGMPVMDLFATSLNAQIPRFLSRTILQGAEGIDALQTS